MRANGNGARQMLESGLVHAARLPRSPLERWKYVAKDSITTTKYPLD